MRQQAGATLAVILMAAAAVGVHSTAPLLAAHARCSRAPGSAIALIRVEQDTTLPYVPLTGSDLSYSNRPRDPRDSLVAVPGTPMPAGRVRLLQLDSSTRRLLAEAGVTDAQPVALIRAAPYREDCRTIRWTDTVPFVIRGEMGYVRATLAQRGSWIGGVPTFVIPDPWYYPYPRRRFLAMQASDSDRIASAEQLFAFSVAFRPQRGNRIASDPATYGRLIQWARRNPSAVDLEPIRSAVRDALVAPDHAAIRNARSHLLGSYRLDISIAGRTTRRFFRTYERAYPWPDADSGRSTAQLIRDPRIGGHVVSGVTRGSVDSLPVSVPVLSTGPDYQPSISLTAATRPTVTPGSPRKVKAHLDVRFVALPEESWNDLEAFVPRPTSLLSRARAGRAIPHNEMSARIPLTLRIEGRTVRADTTILSGGRTMKVSLRRIDTLAILHR